MKDNKEQKDIKQIEECRFYEKEYPNPNDLVMCKIIETVEEGSYLELLEYNHIRGMILKSEISKKRIKNLKQVMKEGKEEVLLALRVDDVQGYIDLSKKDVSTEECQKFQEIYAKSKQVHNIIKSVAMKIGETKLETLYKQFGWKMYSDYGHAYEAFKIISNGDADSVLKNYDLPATLKTAIIDVVNVKMVPHPVKIKGEFRLTCNSIGGVNDIKEALRVGESLSQKDIPIKVKLIASPIYSITTETVRKNEGLDLLTVAIQKIEAAIKEKQGSFVLNSKPEILGDNAKDIEEQLKDIKKNQDDEDNEEEEEDHDEGIKANIEDLGEENFDNISN